MTLLERLRFYKAQGPSANAKPLTHDRARNVKIKPRIINPALDQSTRHDQQENFARAITEFFRRQSPLPPNGATAFDPRLTPTCTALKPP